MSSTGRLEVPDGGTGNQTDHLSTATAQATTFHLFPGMPFEVQDMVWGNACTDSEMSPSLLYLRVRLAWKPDRQTPVICFTPDEQAAASTRGQRSLLGTCRRARQQLLKRLVILAVYRCNLSDGNITEYGIPFDSEITCLCVDDSEGLGLPSEPFRNAEGLSFAKEIRQLVLVMGDDHEIYSPRDVSLGETAYRDLLQMAMLFHNISRFAPVRKLAFHTGRALGHQASRSIFSLQPCEQKTIVEGLRMSKPRWLREHIVEHAMWSALGGWGCRVLDELEQAGLLSILKKAKRGGVQNFMQQSSDPDRHVLAAISLPDSTIVSLLRQLIRDD